MFLKLFSLVVFCVVLIGCGNNNASIDHKEDQRERSILEVPVLEIGHEFVYISNDSRQCEVGNTPPETTAQILIDKGIDVISSHCGRLTGLAVAAVCGGNTLEINLHVINSQNTQDAKETGFGIVSELDSEAGVGFQVIECI